MRLSHSQKHLASLCPHNTPHEIHSFPTTPVNPKVTLIKLMLILPHKHIIKDTPNRSLHLFNLLVAPPMMTARCTVLALVFSEEHQLGAISPITISTTSASLQSAFSVCATVVDEIQDAHSGKGGRVV
jgi:hypothetical protein